jgi:hypothetical protein
VVVRRPRSIARFARADIDAAAYFDPDALSAEHATAVDAGVAEGLRRLAAAIKST